MYELMWFVGGALTYQLLTKILRIMQIFMFFQEIHVHMLMMLESVSQDLDEAMDFKSEMMKESALEKEEVKLITIADKQIIETWRALAVFKMQNFIPGAFKKEVKYDNWNELQKYLSDTIKK